MSGKNRAAPCGQGAVLPVLSAVSLLILLLSTTFATAQDGTARHAALAQMCGADFRNSVQRMMGGQISGEQATDCWCFFWEKAGSNPITMYNGRKASDLCPRRLAQQAPTPSDDHRTVERPGTGTVAGGDAATGKDTHPVTPESGGNRPGTDPRGPATAGEPPITGRPSSPGNPPTVERSDGPGTPSTVERTTVPSTTPPQVTDARPRNDKPNSPGPDRPPGSADPTPPPGSPPVAGPPPANPPRDYAIAPEPAECPQRGKGCAALIIDFSAAMEREDNFGALSKALAAAGCKDVEYVAPKFIAPADYSTSQEVTAQRVNDGNVKSMTDAIARHRERVRKGAELVVEIIKGHGVIGESCGQVIPGVDFTAPAEIPRAGFHRNNYQAVHGNACAWFVADFSCSSGLTPEAVDELNNKGGDTEPACTFKPAEKCINHAAYEGDVAVGSAKSDSLCTFSASRDFNDTITKALQSAAQGPYTPLSAQPGKPSLMNVLVQATRGMPSVYSDGGRKYCGASRRDGYWLNFQSKNR